VKKITSFLILYFVVACMALQAQPSINKNNILIGEPIEIILPGEEVFKNIPDSIPHFEIIDKTNAQKLVLTSFDSGSWNLPSLSYLANGLLQKTDSVLIQVGYMPTDSTNSPRDIKTIIEVDYIDWKKIIIIAILAIGAIITFILLLWLYRNRKKQPKAINHNRFFEEAITSLQNLEQEQKNNSINAETVHVQLSQIFKTYLGNIEYDIPQSTSSQIFTKLEKFKLDAEVAAQTKLALDINDATKFANYNPSSTQNNDAIQFIRKTINDIHKNKFA
jgi:hypothetical protein